LEIFNQNLAILGTGNIGSAIAKGFILSSMIKPEQIILTRRKTKLLSAFEKKGCIISDDNCEAVKKSEIIIIAVPPQQIKELLQKINSDLNPKKHIIISVVSGVTTSEILRLIKKQVQVVRAMPNIASAIRESMTCIASDTASNETIQYAKKIFDYVGKTFIISEEKMVPATALGACGIAFFLRAIRAASQGGIEIGFHSYEAIPMAAQTAKGAAALVLNMDNHPEMEIDKVTTPEGCTIAGLNEMEHQGFSSAMIKGITISADKAEKLYKNNKE